MMKNRSVTEKDFLGDVANHHLNVIVDDGVRRHIRLSRPETGCMRFDILTWPGHLCYTGDMGAFVFSRIEDMFEFFRAGPTDRMKEEGLSLYINPRYWSEKILAADKCDGYEEFSREVFEETVNHYVDNFIENNDLDLGESLKLKDEVKTEVICASDDGDYQAYLAVRDFEFNGAAVFQDFEYRCNEYTHRFLWCCYALNWSIGQYDRYKDGVKKGNYIDDSREGE